MTQSNDPRNCFTTAQAVRATGLSQRQLDTWDKAGVVSPSVRAAVGSGSERRYSAEDLLALLVAGRLRELGWGLRAIAPVLPHADALKSGKYVVASNAFVRTCQELSEVPDAVLEVLTRPDHSGCNIAKVGPLADELEFSLAELCLAGQPPRRGRKKADRDAETDRSKRASTKRPGRQEPKQRSPK